MDREIRVPSVGESIQEALLAHWHKKDGDTVRKDEALFVVETDKVTLEVPAETDGVLHILVPEGQTVAVGQTVGRLSEDRVRPSAPEPPAKAAPQPGPEPAEASAPLASREAAPPEREGVAPSVRRLAAQTGVDLSAVAGTGPGGRVTKGDVLLAVEAVNAAPRAEPEGPDDREPPIASGVVRRPMSPIRRRIAERLLEATRNAALLTTVNDVDMTRVQALRRQHKEAFRERHGVALGITSFFVKAAAAALREHPELNAFVDGDTVEYHEYCHVGVAVGSPRGLVVPVLRHVERLGLPAIEEQIQGLARKVEENRLELADLEGGTFSVTNGGVYGSLLSTPIVNPPQSAILGLHRVEDRPVAIGGQVVIRPMMYVALTYDHRLVDGRQAVTFLRRIKELAEEPARLLLEV